jgi:16S rRNA (cytidine1402-2'-O)-methyltransferase
VSGRLLLVPNLLGAIEPEAALPRRTIELARQTSHWVVETPKSARAFLGSLGMPRPIAELSIAALPASPTPEGAAKLIAPTQQGHDVGMLSDAGCPGVADPGAVLVEAAHARGIAVVPLVGPSAVLLALMAAGMNGQRFAFHGYLPIASDARAAALRSLEAASRRDLCTQVFIETPYRNVAMLQALLATLEPATRLCVACDLTLPTESVVSQPIARWRDRDPASYAKRPAMFLILAAGGRRSRAGQADAKRGS